VGVRVGPTSHTFDIDLAKVISNKALTVTNVSHYFRLKRKLERQGFHTAMRNKMRYPQ
jgi:hypothetical protein